MTKPIAKPPTAAATKAELKLIKTRPAATPQPLDPADVQRWIESREPRSVLNALVTPAVARVLLAYNTPGATNRQISKRWVAACVRILQAGQWENTGEPVIVSDAMLLNDGQQRLTAIVQSGIAAPMDLRFGVPRHAFGATNAGRKRQGGDALMLGDTKNRSTAAGALRMILAYRDGLPRSMFNTYLNSEITEAYERWPDIAEAVHRVVKMKRQLRSSALAALVFLMGRTANEATVAVFCETLQTGEGNRDNPPHRLRDHLLERGAGHEKYDRARTLALGIIAWNAYRKPPHTLTRLTWKTDQPFPLVDDLVL